MPSDSLLFDCFSIVVIDSEKLFCPSETKDKIMENPHYPVPMPWDSLFCKMYFFLMTLIDSEIWFCILVSESPNFEKILCIWYLCPFLYSAIIQFQGRDKFQEMILFLWFECQNLRKSWLTSNYATIFSILWNFFFMALIDSKIWFCILVSMEPNFEKIHCIWYLCTFLYSATFFPSWRR